MANFALGELLSPIDFEHLVRDLLSKDLSIELTAFAEGKDGGIDLRYSKSSHTNDIIVQCKRQNKISKSALEAEYKKLNNLKLKKYYIASSSDFSVNKTTEILSLFSKWMANDKHIYSKNRINKLLDNNEDILKKHYKLWINSSKLFDTFINKSLIERAKFLFKTIKTDGKFYVKNESYNAALEILKDNNFLVISGNPGIGKTTLARILLSDYAQNGFEIIEIRNVTEGEKFLEEDSSHKQAFYFDDFLGENFLKFDVLGGRSNDLMSFIHRIRLSKNKVLILTTREYILKQAKERYEKLNDDDFEIAKHILDLGKYTERIRAYILYNHLYYSGIGDDYLKNIIENRTYKKIINHRSYNPRIIERMTVKLKGIDAENYSKEFLNQLEKPFIIWSRAFDNQISDGSQMLLYVMLSFDGNVTKGELKEAFKNFIEINKISVDFSLSNFNKYLKETEDSFIITNASKRKKHIILNFQNPSVKDFLINNLKENKEILLQLVDSITYINQLNYLINFTRKEFVDNDVIDSLSLKIYEIFNIKESIWIFSDRSTYEWSKSKIEKLKICSAILSISKKSETNQFLVSEIENIGIDEILDRDISIYIELLEMFKTKLKKKKKNIITDLFQKIEGIGTLTGVLNIFKVYPNQSKKYINENNQEIIKKIETIIDESLIKAEDSYEATEIKNCIENMEDILFDNEIELVNDIDYYKSTAEKRFVEIFDEEMSRGKKQELDKIELLEDEIEKFDVDQLFDIKNFHH